MVAYLQQKRTFVLNEIIFIYLHIYIFIFTYILAFNSKYLYSIKSIFILTHDNIFLKILFRIYFIFYQCATKYVMVGSKKSGL